MWSSIHTFVKHHKVDVMAYVEAAMGRRVLLQQIVEHS